MEISGACQQQKRQAPYLITHPAHLKDRRIHAYHLLIKDEMQVRVLCSNVVKGFL